MGVIYTVKDSIHITAPIDRIFLLSTSIDLVGQTLGMKPVAGRTSGLIVKGDRIAWRGWKFGLPTSHVSLITQYDRPHFFQDTMQQGRFERFQHDHFFTEVDGHVLVADKLKFSLPLGLLGKQVSRLVLLPHIRDLLRERLTTLKLVAEGSDWPPYLAGTPAP